MIRTEMPSKQIMNPMRVKMLEVLNEHIGKEATSMYLQNKTGCKKTTADSAIERFAEYGLIKFTGGGYFEITEKGIEYLKSVS